ncbi:MAG: LLM class F420-dependent oxidoreductase [Chloroflexi bacterium]|nr:LLM class F420-dependent oxidoreductase [Chloroflexota bacterium]
MRIGAVFPQTEIGADPGPIREFAEAVENLGFDGLMVYDHVIGADTEHHPELDDPFYDIDDCFHEILVLFGYLAAVTRRIRLITGIVILPQRQTVLVAKQAAEVDVLSGGRLTLGIGIGWNPVEFEALEEDFHNRGRRSEEQIDVMRALWTKKLVDYQGRWHHIRGAGLNPLPVQRPIPIWIGGDAYPVLERIGRIGDGWLPLMVPDKDAKEKVKAIHDSAREAGRDPSAIEIAVVPHLAGSNLNDIVDQIREWQALGATHFYLDTMRTGLGTVSEHIEAIKSFKKVTEKLGN